MKSILFLAFLTFAIASCGDNTADNSSSMSDSANMEGTEGTGSSMSSGADPGMATMGTDTMGSGSRTGMDTMKTGGKDTIR